MPPRLDPAAPPPTNASVDPGKLAALPQKSLDALEELTLHTGDFPPCEVQDLTPVFARMPHLTALTVTDSVTAWDSLRTVEAVRAAAAAPALTSLNLYSCRLDTKGAAALGRALVKLPQLASLTLGGYLDDEAFITATLAPSLAALPNLGTLRATVRGPATAAALGPFLMLFPALRTLEVRANSVGPKVKVNEEGCFAVLRSLGIDCTDLNPTGAAALSLFISGLPHLEALSIQVRRPPPRSMSPRGLRVLQ